MTIDQVSLKIRMTDGIGDLYLFIVSSASRVSVKRDQRAVGFFISIFYWAYATYTMLSENLHWSLN